MGDSRSGPSRPRPKWDTRPRRHAAQQQADWLESRDSRRLPRWRRAWVWVLGAVLAGLSAGIAQLTTHAFDFGAAAVGHAVLPRPAGGAGSGQRAAGGLLIRSKVDAGFTSCAPTIADGYVYPATPGLTRSTKPGSGPKRNGKTWDQAPAAFGAVPAGPILVTLYLTGASMKAVTITGLRVHVISRRPQAQGLWLDTMGGCGGGAAYHYAVADLDAPPPYWTPTAPPTWERADKLLFPYTTTAATPVSLQVAVQAEHSDCTFDLILSWVDGGVTHTRVIDDNGHPFRITSVTGQNHTLWHLGDSTAQTGPGYPAWGPLKR